MVSETGIWSVEESTQHQHSDELIYNLSCLFNKDQFIYDFGCGDGAYLKGLKEKGFNLLWGIDGTNLEQYKFCNFFEWDLSKPLNFFTKGQVISLEVGEHIPQEYEQIFLDTITFNCNSQMIISWAILGQVGIGHINCQTNEYIIEQIENRGFKYDKLATTLLRGNEYINTPWFKDTILKFNKI